MTNQTRTRPKRGVTTQAISDDMEFAAMNANRKPEYITGPIEGEDEGVTEGGFVTSKRVATVLMFKPDGRGGYVPRLNIPVSSIQTNMLNGWKAKCPDCGEAHAGLDPNECTGRDPVAVRVCPVTSCRKRIYDNQAYEGDAIEDEEADPNVLPNDFSASTPETRTQLQLADHMWHAHPRTARLMAIPRPAQPTDAELDLMEQRAGVLAQ